MTAITAIHGDGARRLKYEYRPTTLISHAVQAICGIQYHAVRRDGTGRQYVRPGLFYQGWRWRVQRWCFALERAGRRWF
jgi:hypothetical protein